MSLDEATGVYAERIRGTRFVFMQPCRFSSWHDVSGWHLAHAYGCYALVTPTGKVELP